MSVLDAVILSEIQALKNKDSSLPPVGFGVTMSEKGDLVAYGAAKFLRSGILAKLDSSSSFPEELSYLLPSGTGTSLFGPDFLSAACSDDTVVLTKNGGTKVYVARRADGFVLHELVFPDSAAYRVRYENGLFFFFPVGSTTTVYYSFDDMVSIQSVVSTVGNPKAVRFVSTAQLVFLPQGSSSGSSVSLHSISGGVIAVGSSLSLSGVTYLSDLVAVRSGSTTYFIVFRSNGGPMKATSLAGAYTAIVADPASLGGVSISSGAISPNAGTRFAGRVLLAREGVCYFFLPAVGLVSLDPATNKVAIAISYAGATQDARIFDLAGHFAFLATATDSFRFYSPSMISLAGAPVMAGDLECALSAKLAVRFPSTSAGTPLAVLDFVKYAGLAAYVSNLYLRIE